MKRKGWIVLDIDGTITEDRYSIPISVAHYLSELALNGWSLVFATGRCFKFAAIALSTIQFPYYLLAQNGSVVLKMPEKEAVEKKYFTLADVKLAQKLVEEINVDCLVYAGYESGDFGYYRPGRFSPEDLRYIEELQGREKELWKQVDSFDACEERLFPLLKYFGPSSQMDIVASRLSPFFEVAKIRDPFLAGGELLLVTHRLASKGLTFARLIEVEGRGERVIVAGDDTNDLSLFDEADISIAMPHAPQALLEKADLIAPPTAECGIISALSEAIAK